MADLYDIFPPRQEPARRAPACENAAASHERSRSVPGTVRGHLARALTTRPSLAVGLTVLVYFVLGLVRSFVPRTVGLADDGSGGPVACALGVVPGTDGPRYTTFAIFRWVSADAAECPDAAGSHLVGLTVARWVSTALGAGALDLRVPLVAYCLLVAVLATLVGRLVRGRRYAGIVAGALAWVVLMDAAFVGYAASLYPQGAALAGLVVCTVGLLLLDGGGRQSWVGQAAVVLGGSALVGSSTVAALAVVPLVVLLAWRAWRARSAGPAGPAGWIVPTAAALVLLVPATAAVLSASELARKINTWDLVSTRVLADAPAPGLELESMGVPADAARFVGNPVWSPSSVTTWSRWPEVELDEAAVWGYVASRPGLAVDLVDDVVRAEAEPLPARLGSYDVAGGSEPGAQDRTVTVFSRLQGAFLSLGVVGGVLAWAALAWVAVAVVRTPAHGGRARRLGVTSLVLLGVAATQVVGTALTEGSELTREVVAGNLAGGLALGLLITAGLASRVGSRPGAGPVVEEARPEV